MIYVILSEVYGPAQWQTVSQMQGNREEVKEHRLRPRTIDKIRLTVRKGLFVNEIEAYGPSLVAAK